MLDVDPVYIAQTLIIATVLYLACRQANRMLRIQVIAWALGVTAIALQYGVGNQLNFYSNDQQYYNGILEILKSWNWPSNEPVTLAWWFDYSKFPYPLAAVPLSIAGINPELAMKTVSLICLLALSNEVLRRYGSMSLRDQAIAVYLTGCGLIGTFFSLIALRETMMMYFVYRYATDRSIVLRITSISIVFLLRAHLAAALIVAELALAVWNWLTKRRKLGFAELPLLLVGGVTLGYTMFTWQFSTSQGVSSLRNIQTPFNGTLGISGTIQIASNFAGLQFLTAHEAFVRLSISELLWLRLIFSDTLIVPLSFSVVCVLAAHRLSNRHKFTVLTFAIYVSIVTNTDFNSFRQNIPLMPLMGMVILDFLKDRKLQKSSAPEDVSRASDSSRRAVRHSVSNVAN
jgi:hypothetical protein